LANFPLPIGIDKMLRDIAHGIGDAARLVPARSRSDVGALAVHRASVEVNFELSTQARDERGTFGLGVRSFIFGPSIATGSNEATALNTGRISLEIVAITEPEKADDRKPGKGEELDPAAIRKAIGDMRAALAGLDIGEAEKRKVAAALDMALASLVAGDLAAAQAIIDQLAPGFAALAKASGAVASRGRKKKRKGG
jgi:hypothetical protein